MPSKVFAREVGAPTMQGFAEGILKTVPTVTRTMQKVGDAITQPFEGAGDFVLNALNGVKGAIQATPMQLPFRAV